MIVKDSSRQSYEKNTNKESKTSKWKNKKSAINRITKEIKMNKAKQLRSNDKENK